MRVGLFQFATQDVKLTNVWRFFIQIWDRNPLFIRFSIFYYVVDSILILLSVEVLVYCLRELDVVWISAEMLAFEILGRLKPLSG